MVHKITNSLLLVIFTGIISNTEGVLFGMSRMGMLDIFQALFITLIAFCLLFSPLILISYSIINGFYNSLSNIFFSISLTGLGIIFIVLTLKITELVHKLILKYLLWYIKTVKGSVKK